MDRRVHKATHRVAHVSLKGQTNLPLTDGEGASVIVALADLLSRPGGARERQLALGETFVVIDRDQGYAFGFAEKDGYCGWLPDSALGAAFAPTHWVCSPGTHLYEGPKVQRPTLMALSLGARVKVVDVVGDWMQTPLGFIPTRHLFPVGQVFGDPVTQAEGFLHVPYLWGGNSRAGVDCSGLAQMAHLACGIDFPGDSDLQESVGHALPEGADVRRGDLIFWEGHIAMVVDGTRLIHANGHTMSVAYEGIDACIARIATQGGGPVTHRRRIAPPSR